MHKIITIDGPSGVGKGTASRMLATQLGWDWLDSGALYRLTAYAAQINNIAFDNDAALADIARNLNVKFSSDANSDDPDIILDNQVVNQFIRTEDCGVAASKVSAHPAVREALFERQRAFLTEKGLVADGRDMGTTIFPEAPVKIFLTASAEVRAQRRQNQLNSKGLDVNISHLLDEIKSRDLRDKTRVISPLVPAEEALVIDTGDLTPEKVCEKVLNQWKVASST